MLIAAAPCFWLAWVLLNVWLEPMAWDEGHWVRFGLGLMMLEFVVLHSGAFMSALGSKQASPIGWRLLAGMMVFYGLIVWAFAQITGSDTLLLIFAAIVISRVIALLIDREHARAQLMKRSSCGIVLYILIAFASVIIPVPEMGITAEVLSEVYPDRGGGLWERQPQLPIAGAALYFALMGCAELKLIAGASSTSKAD